MYVLAIKGVVCAFEHMRVGMCVCVFHLDKDAFIQGERKQKWNFVFALAVCWLMRRFSFSLSPSLECKYSVYVWVFEKL